MKAARFHGRKNIQIENIPLDQAALIEPLSVGHHAFVRSGAKVGDVAFVGGAGPIGLLLCGFETLIHHNDSAVKIIVHP